MRVTLCACVCVFQPQRKSDPRPNNPLKLPVALKEYPVSFRPQRAYVQVNTLIKLHSIATSFFKEETVNGVSSGKVVPSSLDGFLQEENVYLKTLDTLLYLHVSDQGEEGKLVSF